MQSAHNACRGYRIKEIPPLPNLAFAGVRMHDGALFALRTEWPRGFENRFENAQTCSNSTKAAAVACFIANVFDGYQVVFDTAYLPLVASPATQVPECEVLKL